jgi:hypothetical protein
MKEPTDKKPPAGKKQVPLRLSPELYKELAAWAEADFRSLNSQIEYLLHECVQQHRRGRHGNGKI